MSRTIGFRKTITTCKPFVVMFAVIALTVACASNPSDSRAKQGAAKGAAIGAGIGLLLGVLSGDSDVAARAVAIGATSGAIRGGYEGWRQDQDDERTRQITEAIRESSEAGRDTGDRDREQLTRFLGVWQMEGWVVEPETGRINVSAQVNGTVQMSYFVELAWIDLKAEGFEGQIWGTTTLGFDTDTGYELSTRFNTLPDAIEASGGRFDASSRTFTWADGNGTTTVRFESPDRFYVQTRIGRDAVESYTFTRS